jgi:hypothetical protein
VFAGLIAMSPTPELVWTGGAAIGVNTPLDPLIVYVVMLPPPGAIPACAKNTNRGGVDCARIGRAQSVTSEAIAAQPARARHTVREARANVRRHIETRPIMGFLALRQTSCNTYVISCAGSYCTVTLTVVVADCVPAVAVIFTV